MTFISKLTGLLLIIVFLAGCNSGENTRGNKQVFLLDDFASVSLLVEDVIEYSDINAKGFVVIIPDKSEAAVKQANKMKQEFYKKEIMAVHILNINPAADLLRTDVITIENAKIICLPGRSKLDLSKNNQYGVSLLNALKNDAFIVVNNKETEQVFANAIKP